MQELKRQIMRKLDHVDDEILLSSILEMLNDHDNDEEQDEVEERSVLDREDNRTLPPPIDRRYKGDADSWLDSLGR